MNKLSRRKFQVWIVSVVIFGISIFITKTVMPEMINMFTVVSCLYMGSNATKAYIDMKRDKKE